ncbi:MAG TPA: glycine cleavage T C-terminal barrel domain-containing protein [Ignavibacteria bacterium]|nr:glycine cleavage T C-terminal barrel domain-containing protein [Ignavibacteria bacterium]HMQ97987.1 glycine cleavage T C-terminal barrel domain-containing protein [Ignavibacteria bacterium]
MLNFYRLPQDYLKFTGNERLDLINRLSSNMVLPLDKFSCVKTVLTSDKGRIIDLLTLYNLGEVIFASCSFNNAKAVQAHLDKYTIMDDFTAVDLSGAHNAILFFGNRAIEFVSLFAGCNIASLNEGRFLVTAEHDAIITLNDNAFGGAEFIYSAADKDYWENKIFAAESRSEFTLNEINDAEYNVLRVEHGIPAFGREMSELTNPLECSLNRYVSFTKGCYIGQEVIARLDAYDKISKHLTGFRIFADTMPAEAGQFKITIDGKECGFLTSTAYSETYGYIALGFVKTIFLDYGKTYKLKYNEGLLDCSIVKLPFTA